MIHRTLDESHAKNFATDFGYVKGDVDKAFNEFKDDESFGTDDKDWRGTLLLKLEDDKFVVIDERDYMVYLDSGKLPTE